METILLVGTDMRLLSTRAIVLSKTGATVDAVAPWQVQDRPVDARLDLVLLCHTLDESERASVISQARARWPQVCVLQVKGLRNPEENVGSFVDGAISSDPRAMLETASLFLFGRRYGSNVAAN